MGYWGFKEKRKLKKREIKEEMAAWEEQNENNGIDFDRDGVPGTPLVTGNYAETIRASAFNSTPVISAGCVSFPRSFLRDMLIPNFGEKGGRTYRYLNIDVRELGQYGRWSSIYVWEFVQNQYDLFGTIFFRKKSAISLKSLKGKPMPDRMMIGLYIMKIKSENKCETFTFLYPLRRKEGETSDRVLLVWWLVWSHTWWLVVVVELLVTPHTCRALQARLHAFPNPLLLPCPCAPLPPLSAQASCLHRPGCVTPWVRGSVKFQPIHHI